MTADRKAVLRQLPKIDEVLKRDDVDALELPRWAVLEAVRREVDARRASILSGDSDSVDVTTESIVRRATALIEPSVRRVINATGVVLHTNLGRAPLGAEVLERMTAVALGYSNLEYDVAKGKRGSRHGHLAKLVRDLTGAEDAVAVNNNAGAVMLCLAALGHGREVIVSRGELIEIGGSFRIPDVMRLSGARLVEVGTTNKTHRKDYEIAIGPETALLLKVHRSNFDVVGFTSEVAIEELVDLGRDRGIPSMFDLGSGALLEAREMVELGLPAEPSVRAVVAAGVDVVTFSGDKLLGGPQAGVIAGRADAIEAVRSHPMMRALRPDKMSIGALEATLAIYRDGRAREAIPAVAMLAAPLVELRKRAEALLEAIGEAPEWISVELLACDSAVGGGAMPAATLPSWGVGLSPRGDVGGANAIDKRLRSGATPVIGRIADDRLILDVRTLCGDDEIDVAAAVVRAL